MGAINWSLMGVYAVVTDHGQSLSEAGYQYLVHILSPLNDKCSSQIGGSRKMAEY